jgi:hypothetical protein
MIADPRDYVTRALTPKTYNDVALQGAKWSLRIAIERGLSAVEEADLAGVVMLRSERGAMDVFDVVRSNVHDSHHHCWDLTRILRRH